MQVGDLIIGVRELIPDLPRTLAPPTGATAAVVASAGSTLPAGTYTLVLTATNRWGETLPTSPVIGLVVGAGQGIQVTAPLVTSVPGASGLRAYFALSGQPYMQFQSSSSLPFTISSPGLPGTPATRATAFYPDSDGPRFSAYTLYRWLNEALETASMVTGGILDTCAFPTVAGQGLYYVPGNWKKLFDCWFDGFPSAYGGAKDMFYRNVLSGNIPFLNLLQYSAERQLVELQPQPGRTAGSSTLANQLNIGQNLVTAVSLAGFALSIGLAIVGAYPVGGYPTGPYEVIEFSSMNGAQLLGCARGLGGTVESQWPAGTPIVEANYRFNGMRIFNSPEWFPGMATSQLNIPPGWKRPLTDYMLNKAQEGQQSAADATRKLQEFSGLIKSAVKGNDQVGGPRQVGGTSYPGDGYPTAGGFRTIVP